MDAGPATFGGLETSPITTGVSWIEPNPFPLFLDAMEAYSGLALPSFYLPLPLSSARHLPLPTIDEWYGGPQIGFYTLKEDEAVLYDFLLTHEQSHLTQYTQPGSLFSLANLAVLRSYLALASIVRSPTLSPSAWLALRDANNLTAQIYAALQPTEEAFAYADSAHLTQLDPLLQPWITGLRDAFVLRYAHKFAEDNENYGPAVSSDFRYVYDQLVKLAQSFGHVLLHSIVKYAQDLLPSSEWQRVIDDHILAPLDDTKPIRVYSPALDNTTALLCAKDLLNKIRSSDPTPQPSGQCFDMKQALDLLFQHIGEHELMEHLHKGAAFILGGEDKRVMPAVYRAARALQAELNQILVTTPAARPRLHLWDFEASGQGKTVFELPPPHNAWRWSPAVVVRSHDTLLLSRRHPTTDQRELSVLQGYSTPPGLPRNFLAYYFNQKQNRAVLFGRSSPSPGGGVRPLVTARATNAIPPADLGWWWTEVAIWLFLESMRQQIQAHKGLSCPLKASIAAGTFPRLPGAPKDCCGLHQWLWKVYRDGLDIPTRARRLGFDWPDWDRDSWLPPDCPVPTDRSDGPLRAANSTTNARFVLAPYKPKSLGSLEAYRSWEAGSHHYEAARYSEAIQAFQNAMKVEGDPERVAACKIAIAHSLQMSGSYRASQVWYDKVTQDPDVPQVIKEAARAGQRIPALSQPDSSMPPSPGLGIPSLPPFDPPIELDSTATADDFFEAASHQMQMALKLTEEQNFMASNYWQRAIGLWDRLLTIDPNNAFAHGERGTVYRHLGDFQQAKECYRRAAEIDKIAWLPKLIEIGSQQMQNALGATHQSADANAMRGLWEKALDTWTQVLTIDPNNALAHGERGTAYRYLGDFQQAKEGYRRAIEIDKVTWVPKLIDLGNAQTNSAIAATQQARSTAEALQLWQPALETLREVLTIDPNNAFAHGSLGTAYDWIGDKDRAEKCYRTAANLDEATWLPRLHELQVSKLIGIGSQQMQDALRTTQQSPLAEDTRRLWEAALHTWGQVLAIDPGNALAHGERGTAYRYLGDFRQAKECYRRAAEIDKVTWVPKLIDLGNAQRNSAIAATTQSGLTEHTRQMWEALIDIWRQLLDIDIHPNDAPVYYAIGTVYAYIGEKEQARISHAKAAQLDPKYKEFLDS